jgi:hypothetical protein
MEPYGPVKACNGIALPLPLFVMTEKLVVGGNASDLYSINAGF